MNPPWKQYQEDCASFFRHLGLSAEVEKIVDGARGTHAIDIVISGVISGIPITWIVECKAWKTNIPKDKVLTLLSIVQDTGADKGILLSEIGFQSGAILNAKNTNLLLTSLDDLKEQVKESLNESIIANIHWRLRRIQGRLHDLHDDKLSKRSIHIDQLVKIMNIDLAFDRAIRGEYPVLYCCIPFSIEKRFYANTLEELVAQSNKLLCEAEAYVSLYEANIPPKQKS